MEFYTFMIPALSGFRYFQEALPHRGQFVTEHIIWALPPPDHHIIQGKRILSGSFSDQPAKLSLSFLWYISRNRKM